MTEKNFLTSPGNSVEVLLSRLLSIRDEIGLEGALGPVTPDDWEKILSAASRHGVRPLLYERLKPFEDRGRVPESVLNRLHRTYLRSAATQVLFSHSLSRILRGLHGLKIPVIPLKGAYLAETVYDDPALRPMIDLDILVPRGDLSRSVDCLEELGWTSSRTFDLEAESALIHHLPLFTSGEGVKVEVHWTLTRPANPFQIDLEGVWQRSLRGEVAGVEARVLSPEDLLLHQCLHFAFQHGCAMGLRSLFDIVGILGRFGSEMNWKVLVDRAGEWEAGRSLALSLRLADDMLGAGIPEQAGALIAESGIPEELYEVARGQVLTAEELPPGLSSNLLRVLSGTALTERAKVLLESLFPSRDFLATLYPVSPGSLGILLCYPRRWKDLATHYGPSALRLLRGDAEKRAAAGKEGGVNVLKGWLGGEGQH